MYDLSNVDYEMKGNARVWRPIKCMTYQTSVLIYTFLVQFWKPIKCMTYQTGIITFLYSTEFWKPTKCMTYQTVNNIQRLIQSV